MGFEVIGTGHYVPGSPVPNERLSKVMDTSDDWIFQRSGIRQRHYAGEGQAASDFAFEASKRALESARITPKDVDYIIFATMTPEYVFPGSGAVLGAKLGIDGVPALDIRQQCAGFAYGLQVVDALIGSGLARHVLLVGCDVHTSLMPFSERTWAVLEGRDEEPLPRADFEWNSRFRHLVVLFGDAAGAMVFRAEEGAQQAGILGSLLYGDGGHREVLAVPGAGSTRRPWVTPEQIAAGETVPVMDGRQVFKLAVTRMPRATRDLLARHGYALEDLDLLVMHQANLRINEAAQRALGLPDAKVHNNIERYGNTTSATLPLAFHEARAAGKAPEGALVAFAALGAGLHWGAVLMRV
jgi:3-oxoacyl-[acyl-carrier-protein] synthase-3